MSWSTVYSLYPCFTLWSPPSPPRSTSTSDGMALGVGKAAQGADGVAGLVGGDHLVVVVAPVTGRAETHGHNWIPLIPTKTNNHKSG